MYHSTHTSEGQTSARRTPSRDPAVAAFAALLRTARALHSPAGCAWDRAQTLTSLFPYALEELWEAFEAMRARRRRAFREELGDALYSLLFLALIAERTTPGMLARLLTDVNHKMVRRHAHVFRGARAPSQRQAYQQWESMKRQEPRRSPSPSKEFRTSLVSLWDWLRVDPEPRARQLLAVTARSRRRGR